jgi:hypothetical protein
MERLERLDLKPAHSRAYNKSRALAGIPPVCRHKVLLTSDCPACGAFRY